MPTDDRDKTAADFTVAARARRLNDWADVEKVIGVLPLKYPDAPTATTEQMKMATATNCSLSMAHSPAAAQPRHQRLSLRTRSRRTLTAEGSAKTRVAIGHAPPGSAEFHCT